MPHGSVIARMPATSSEVFELLHDYGRRLEWDTLLAAAWLADDCQAAGPHAIAVCRGRSILGGIEMRTEYVSFQPSLVAAVKMVNRPPFFDTFAATIRHRDLGGGRSEVEYKYHFTARPRWLRFLLHPLMGVVFRYETQRRLAALARYLAKRQHSSASVQQGS